MGEGGGSSSTLIESRSPVGASVTLATKVLRTVGVLPFLYVWPRQPGTVPHGVFPAGKARRCHGQGLGRPGDRRRSTGGGQRSNLCERTWEREPSGPRGGGDGLHCVPVAPKPRCVLCGAGRAGRNPSGG